MTLFMVPTGKKLVSNAHCSHFDTKSLEVLMLSLMLDICGVARSVRTVKRERSGMFCLEGPSAVNPLFCFFIDFFSRQARSVLPHLLSFD